MDEAEGDGSMAFPRVVTWGSLCLALLMFFGTTVPALRERSELQGIEADTLALRNGYDRALRNALATGRGSLSSRPEEDLQALLVAIDRLGLTPAELLLMYPPPPEIDARAEDR